MEKIKKKQDKIKTLRLKESEIRLLVESLILTTNQLDELAKTKEPGRTPSTADRTEDLYKKIRVQAGME